ncbi:transcription elongation factor GreB [Nitrosomonas sp. Nm33]|uniref:transcription elongation factor GreB n=1 Tax=Nitrosomonas sp. Nm33 TaxID=133724 RepID=UPI00089A7D26|nr:transcription elongation factor GreB [Nitrosomonas sp. Nm33]SDY11813.1 transcription elongation factor GreB [Nitrosomonas sp. Nm33]
MSKAFIKEMDTADEFDEEASASPLPIGSKNYITPGGHARLTEEYLWLLNKERPDVTATVAWAAGNGDRSENGDYIYGKKRLREIDKRLRFLSKRLDMAEIVDPTTPREDPSRIFFGATVCYADQNSHEKTVSIVGVDEIDPLRGYISWISPVARALISAREGDTVTLLTPAGIEKLDILSVDYQQIFIPPFEPVTSK